MLKKVDRVKQLLRVKLMDKTSTGETDKKNKENRSEGIIKMKTQKFPTIVEGSNKLSEDSINYLKK